VLEATREGCSITEQVFLDPLTDFSAVRGAANGVSGSTIIPTQKAAQQVVDTSVTINKQKLLSPQSRQPIFPLVQDRKATTEHGGTAAAGDRSVFKSWMGWLNQAPSVSPSLNHIFAGLPGKPAVNVQGDGFETRRRRLICARRRSPAKFHPHR